MGIIGALTKKFHYSVQVPGLGRLVYREGNHEYTFPVYEEDGAVVVVGAGGGADEACCAFRLSMRRLI